MTAAMSNSTEFEFDHTLPAGPDILEDIVALVPDWKHLIAQLDETIIHVDVFDSVSALTPSAGQLLCTTPAVKSTLDEVVSSLGADFLTLLDKARRQPPKKVRGTLQDSQGRFFEVTARNVISDHGLSLGVFFILHDFTKYHVQQQKISTFVSMVAHELLNPMAPIMEGLNLIADEQMGTLNDVQRHCLAVVAEETSRLARLVNDLLDISRFDCGKIQIQRIPVDVPRLLSSAVNNVSARAVAKGISIEIKYHELSADLFGDHERLRQVIINLLENAIKYSAPGKQIVLSVLSRKDHINISVKDQGFGMARRDIPRLFERFTQLNYPDHIRNRGQGSGLGLAIVHEIVKLHRGKIKVFSELNQGSEFIVVLPKRRKGRLS